MSDIFSGFAAIVVGVAAAVGGLFAPAHAPNVLEHQFDKAFAEVDKIYDSPYAKSTYTSPAVSTGLVTANVKNTTPISPVVKTEVTPVETKVEPVEAKIAKEPDYVIESVDDNLIEPDVSSNSVDENQELASETVNTGGSTRIIGEIVDLTKVPVPCPVVDDHASEYDPLNPIVDSRPVGWRNFSFVRVALDNPTYKHYYVLDRALTERWGDNLDVTPNGVYYEVANDGVTHLGPRGLLYGQIVGTRSIFGPVQPFGIVDEPFYRRCQQQ